MAKGQGGGGGGKQGGGNQGGGQKGGAGWPSKVQNQQSGTGRDNAPPAAPPPASPKK